MKTSRRTSFIALLAVGSSSLLVGQERGLLPTNPNILLIMTDQLSHNAMSCVQGNTYINTPHMDSLAEDGVRFTRAYSPNPLCIPMRTSTILGKFPHQTGIQDNSKDPLVMDDHVVLGKVFKDAGYDTGYFGKWHIRIGGEETNVHGFDEFRSGNLFNTKHAVAFITRERSKPFFAVASFLSPHEICEWARKQEIPGDQLPEVPSIDKRPPLLSNAGIPEDETDTITLIRKAYHAAKAFPVGNYTEDDWRRLSWGYYRLVERADSLIGTVLDALRQSGQHENTVVMFVSDHGDCIGAHQFNQKTVFYEESVHVPFIVNWKGVTSGSTCDELVNIGTDIYPTLCDFASIDARQKLPGESLRSLVLGEKPSLGRDYIVSENYMTQGAEVDGVKPYIHGRMVRSEKYKYCIYSQEDHRESLVDIEQDPGEMKNLARNTSYATILQQHRAMLKEHGETYNDLLALDMLKAITGLPPTPTPEPVPDDNIALHKPVASSGAQVKNPASNVVDDNMTSRWSKNGRPAWIMIDLGKEYSVGRTEIVCYKNRAYQYTIETAKSSNGPFTLVSDRSTNTIPGTKEVPLEDTFETEARFVKIAITGCNNYIGTWASLLEVRIFQSQPAVTPTPTTCPINTNNLLVNPSFKQGATGWKNIGDVWLLRTTESQDNDGASIMNRGGSTKNLYQDVKIKANTDYTYSVWIKTISLSKGRVVVDTRDVFDKQGVQYIHGARVTDTDWHFYAGTFNSGDRTSVRIRAYAKDLEGKVVLDNFVLAEK